MFRRGERGFRGDKKMKKTILFLVLLINSAVAEINEFKVDLVYSTDMILPKAQLNEQEDWINMSNLL